MHKSRKPVPETIPVSALHVSIATSAAAAKSDRGCSHNDESDVCCSFCFRPNQRLGGGASESNLARSKLL